MKKSEIQLREIAESTKLILNETFKYYTVLDYL